MRNCIHGIVPATAVPLNPAAAGPVRSGGRPTFTTAWLLPVSYYAGDRRERRNEARCGGVGDVKHRWLGRSGLQVSAIGLGCMGMSQAYGTRDDEESTLTLLRALDLGVTF